MTKLPLRAVLDSTAIVAYVGGSVNVGEVLAEITDEGCGFAIPDVCLVEAAARVDAEEWAVLDVLLDHSHCVRQRFGDDWRDLARAVRALGGLGRAAAMLSAVDHGICLLTAEPEAYGEGNALVIGV